MIPVYAHKLETIKKIYVRGVNQNLPVKNIGIEEKNPAIAHTRLTLDF